VVATNWLKRVPWFSVSLLIGCMATLAIPLVAELLVYERAAIARGEVWRIFGAHAVHYSGLHLFNNLLVLMPAVLLTEMRYPKELVRVLVVSAAAIGLAIFIFEPGILRYAGASGVSLGLITYVALRGLAGNRRWQTVCGLVLALVGVKLAGESLFGWQLVNWEQEGGFVTVTLAHLAGVVSGLVVWCAHILHDKYVRFVPTEATRIIRL